MLVRAGMGTSMMSGVILALILTLNCFISLAFYVPVLSILSFAGKENRNSERAPEKKTGIPKSVVYVVVLLAFVTVYLGLFPASFDWIAQASRNFFMGGVAIDPVGIPHLTDRYRSVCIGRGLCNLCMVKDNCPHICSVCKQNHALHWRRGCGSS